MGQCCSLSVRPADGECPTFTLLSFLTPRDRRLHTNCLPAMPSISCQLLNCPQELSEDQQSRPGAALKEYRRCIRVPENIARCCLIYKDGNKLSVLNRQTLWQTWMAVHRSTSCVHRSATIGTFNPTCFSVVLWWKKKKNAESKDGSIEVLILIQPHSLSADAIWLLSVLSLPTQGVMPAWFYGGPASIGCSQHRHFFSLLTVHQRMTLFAPWG